jgi:Zn-dependent membrane protease YugP
VQVTVARVSHILHCVFFMFGCAVRAISTIAIGMHVTTGLIVASVLDLRVKSVTSNVRITTRVVQPGVPNVSDERVVTTVLGCAKTALVN